jgi:hypothetical protein
MQTPEALRDVAIPADRLVCRENIGQLLGTNSLPLRRPEIQPQ